jgi:iron complex outermembrane receptor protein
LTLTYSDAKYGETDTSEAGQFPTLLTDPILSNKTVSLNPEWTIDLGYEHSWNLANGGRIAAEGQFFLSDGYWNTIEQWYPGAWTEGYHKSNAFLKYFSPSDKWSLNAWVRNIENADPTLFVFPWYRRMIGDPRTYGLTFTYRWQ